LPPVSVTVDCTPIIDGLVTVTVTPGRTPPLLSATLPLIEPVVDAPPPCANACVDASRQTARCIAFGRAEITSVTLVDSEVQRDPDYQARLSARLARATAGPQVPITDDLAELLTPQSSTGPGVPVATGARASAGPELCLDPDPFAPDHSVETVGALAAVSVPKSAPETATTMTMVLPDFGEMGDPSAQYSPMMTRVRVAWLQGPKARPWEALAIAVFLVGAVLGQWVVLLIAGLIACTSRYFTAVEKWALVVGVPVATGLVYAFGFWLHQHGFWGGTAVNTSDLLSGAASFFGTLPRIAALLAALFLGWRLARGITRQF